MATKRLNRELDRAKRLLRNQSPPVSLATSAHGTEGGAPPLLAPHLHEARACHADTEQVTEALVEDELRRYSRVLLTLVSTRRR